MFKEKVTIPRATLDIFRYKKDGVTYYEFDATACQPPEPMVNAIVCLNNLKDDEVLEVTFFHEPTPLYDKISDNFSYEATALDSGDFRILFKKRQNKQS